MKTNKSNKLKTEKQKQHILDCSSSRGTPFPYSSQKLSIRYKYPKSFETQEM